MVLAAGGSSRFGSPKQLVVHEGMPLVRRAALTASEAGADPVVVVLGAYAELVRDALSELHSVQMVLNLKWETGLASSLAAGIRRLFEEATCDAALVTLADQPLVDAALLKRLLAAFGDEHRIVASEYSDGTLGVPAVFAREYGDDLMRLTGDSGAGQWLRSRSSDVTRVRLGDAALDIDTDFDMSRLNPATRGLL